MKFAALDVSNEESLRDMIHKVINRVDVYSAKRLKLLIILLVSHQFIFSVVLLFL